MVQRSSMVLGAGPQYKKKQTTVIFEFLNQLQEIYMSVPPVDYIQNPIPAALLTSSLSAELVNMGIKFEKWSVENIDLTHIDPKNPTATLIEEIVKGDLRLVDRLYEFRTPNGSMDLVNLHPDMPGLDELLVKFEQIHDHAAPEIRLILDGEGIFNIYNSEGDRFEIPVQKGDFLFIPAEVMHNFKLTDKHAVQALRVFQDNGGWVARPRK